MSAVKVRDEQNQATRNRGGKVLPRPVRPVEERVDYDALITAAMKQYPKTRARLAE
jgi:hypothetical protein